MDNRLRCSDLKKEPGAVAADGSRPMALLGGCCTIESGDLPPGLRSWRRACYGMVSMLLNICTRSSVQRARKKKKSVAGKSQG